MQSERTATPLPTEQGERLTTQQRNPLTQTIGVPPAPLGMRHGRVKAAIEMLLEVSGRLTLPELAELTAAVMTELERRRADGA